MVCGWGRKIIRKCYVFRLKFRISRHWQIPIHSWVSEWAPFPICFSQPQWVGGHSDSDYQESSAVEDVGRCFPCCVEVPWISVCLCGGIVGCDCVSTPAGGMAQPIALAITLSQLGPAPPAAAVRHQPVQSTPVDVSLALRMLGQAWPDTGMLSDSYFFVAETSRKL